MVDKNTKSSPMLPPIPKEDEWEKYSRIEQWRRGHLSVLKDLHKNVRYDIDNLANDISNNANDVSNNANDIANNANDISNNANDISNNANDIANKGFGTWIEPGNFAVNTNHTANTDGIVVVTAETTGITGVSPIGSIRMLHSSASNEYFSGSFPVKNGDVWNIASDHANDTYISWLPLE